MAEQINTDDITAKAEHCVFDLLHNHPDDVDMKACADLINALLAERAQPLRSQPHEFDVAELFDAIEWRGEAYIKMDDHMDTLDRFANCSDALRAFRAAEAALRESVSWRSIDTVPDRVDVFMTDGKHIGTGQMVDMSKIDCGNMLFNWGWGTTPTHWMPGPDLCVPVTSEDALTEIRGEARSAGYRAGVDTMASCIYKYFGSVSEMLRCEEHNDAVLEARTKALANEDGKLNMNLSQSEQYVEAIREHAHVEGWNAAINAAALDVLEYGGSFGSVGRPVKPYEVSQEIRQLAKPGPNVAEETS